MLFLTFCLGSLLLIVNADTSVHILSTKYGNGQLVTSSILNWIPETHYSATKNFVMGGFEIVESADNPSDITKRPIFVCRALHNGIWVAGGQKEGEKRCTVTLSSSVGSYEHYQLLENQESAARINWTEWSKFYQPPVGSVATGKLYVARHIAGEQLENGVKPSQTHYVGTLSAQEKLGIITYVKEDGQEGSAESGELLVETEPTSYELTNVKLNTHRQRIAKRHPRILGQAVIENPSDAGANMAEAFPYSYQYTLSWGQGHAMLKGLNTSIVLQNKTRLPDMKWGIAINESRTSVYDVEIFLDPGTAVNVTLRADHADVEVPYSGKLYSRYDDGGSINPRMISGVRREETIINIVPEFGPIYFLGNFSLVPTTIPPPTTEPMTSTTMQSTLGLTTMTTTHQQEQTDNDLSKEIEDEQYVKEHDENAILSSSKHRPEATGMQGDDGGPQSLNAKAEGSPDNGAADHQISLTLAALTTTLAILIVNHRIT